MSGAVTMCHLLLRTGVTGLVLFLGLRREERVSAHKSMANNGSGNNEAATVTPPPPGDAEAVSGALPVA
eukprot:2935403-Prorocentrum_lima.AAC.1